jgi:hypothetical protein
VADAVKGKAPGMPTREKDAAAYLLSIAEAVAEAVRFALDVDGDGPSWSQLRAAVKRAEGATELGEGAASLCKQLGLN